MWRFLSFHHVFPSLKAQFDRMVQWFHERERDTMTHFDATRHIPKPPEQDEETRVMWLPVNAQMSRYVNALSKRNNLHVEAGPTMGGPKGEAACFWQFESRIDVNTDKTLGSLTPEEVHLDKESWKLENSPCMGVLSHESGHACWSDWSLLELMEEFPDEQMAVWDIWSLLEESRIEAKMVREHPLTRKYLRASAASIVAKDFKIKPSKYGAAGAAALLLARVTAGVFKPSAMKDVRDEIGKYLEPDELANLERLWSEFQKLNTSKNLGTKCPDTRRGIEICREWLTTLGIDPDEPPMLMLISIAASDAGQEAGRGGDGEQQDESGSEFAIIIQRAATKESTEAQRSNSQQAEDLLDREQDEQRKAEDERRKRAKEAAAVAFPRGDEKTKGKDGHHDEEDRPPSHGATFGGDAHLITTRPPRDEEHRAAHELADALDRAKYRDKDVRRVNISAPPGRMRGKAAILEAVQEDREFARTAQPWRRKKRTAVDEPELAVGIGQDISGSMNRAEKPCASLAWITSKAVQKVHGKSATVAFGETVHGMFGAYDVPEEVHVYHAGDGHENFPAAFDVLDGELDFLQASGARMLILFSDGHYGINAYSNYCDQAMAWCKASGVAVVWVDVSGSFNHNHGYGEVVSVGGMTPVEAAVAIGEKCVDALAEASA